MASEAYTYTLTSVQSAWPKLWVGTLTGIHARLRSTAQEPRSRGLSAALRQGSAPPVTCASSAARLLSRSSSCSPAVGAGSSNRGGELGAPSRMTPRRRLVLRSPSNHELILNAVAAGFVMEQDELVFALCVSHTAQAYGSNQLPTDLFELTSLTDGRG